MSEEKFSQAPWNIEEPVKDDELRYNDGYNYTIWGGHKKHRHSLALVLCNGRPGDADYPKHCFDEAIANVHLIAAAPEMYRNNEQTLTELEQMIPAMLAVCADCNHRKCKVCQFAKVLKTASEMERRIEQVQKKARGES